MKTSTTKNRIYVLFAVTLAFVMAVAALSGVSFAPRKAVAEEQVPSDVATSAYSMINVTVSYYYYRSDGDYSSWDIWTWKHGADGEALEFDSDTVTIQGKTFAKATKEMTGISVDLDDPTANVVGAIFRLPDWSNREPSDLGGDRFVTVGDLVKEGDNYTAAFYCVSGDKINYTSEEDVDLRVRIASAKFTTVTAGEFTVSEPIAANKTFELYNGERGNGGTKVDATFTARAGAIKGSFSTDAAVDITATYYIYDADVSEEGYRSSVVSKTALYETKEFAEAYNYEGNDLGVTYTAEKSVFKVWSPFIKSAKLKLYTAGNDGELISSTDMAFGSKGVWSVEVAGDLKNKYYTYEVENMNGIVKEIVDPYAKSAGLDGKRGMILDFSTTNPDGWDAQAQPELKNRASAVIYEAHIRDLTIHESSGVSEANRGKYLGLTETGTKNADGKSTALDYIKELGVTEVHILPSFDFSSVSEGGDLSYNKAGAFNWGYDPLNYNVPEGSYSSDPTKGEVRVKEFKQMVMALHNAGIRVIMDVVYNHTNSTDSNFGALGADYYYRVGDGGNFLNGSGCGNETASNHYMFGKFMVESVLHWSKEYKVDGFRFDLMGLHDIDTMNEIATRLREQDPDALIYGEGWDAGTNGLPEEKRAIRTNAKKMPGIAVFNDTVRDGLKGSVFEQKSTGFIQSETTDVKAVSETVNGWTGAIAGCESNVVTPDQNINYVSAHDNNTLWDKLNLSAGSGNSTIEQLKSMNRMAATSVLLGQGIAFFQAGEEMLRSKPCLATDENNDLGYYIDPVTFERVYVSGNSYNMTDSTNAIDWSLRSTNEDMVEYYKGLIALSKAYPEFNLATAAEITSSIEILTDTAPAMYRIKLSDGNVIIVALNNNRKAVKVGLPEGSYNILVQGDKAGTATLGTVTTPELTIESYGAVVLVSTAGGTGDIITPDPDPVPEPEPSDKDSGKLSQGQIIGLSVGIPGGVIVVVAAVILTLYFLKKKKAQPVETPDDKPSNGEE